MPALSNSPRVYTRLPRAGLGNKLLVYGQALRFSHINNFSLGHTFWNNYQLTSVRFGSKSSRLYHREFTGQRKALFLYHEYFRFLNRHRFIVNPLVERVSRANRSDLYLFNSYERDYFSGLFPFRILIKEKFEMQLKSHILQSIISVCPNSACIHVRGGDFTSARIALPAERYKKLLTYATDKAERVYLMSDMQEHHARDLCGIHDTNIMFLHTGSVSADLLTLCKFSYIAGNLRSTFLLWASLFSSGKAVGYDDDLLECYSFPNDKLICL